MAGGRRQGRGRRPKLPRCSGPAHCRRVRHHHHRRVPGASDNSDRHLTTPLHDWPEFASRRAGHPRHCGVPGLLQGNCYTSKQLWRVLPALLGCARIQPQGSSRDLAAWAWAHACSGKIPKPAAPSFALVQHAFQSVNLAPIVGLPLQVLLMFGPEYARSSGIEALEPLGVYLPGDKNYPGEPFVMLCWHRRPIGLSFEDSCWQYVAAQQYRMWGPLDADES